MAGVWDGLGFLMGALGRLLPAFGMFNDESFSSMRTRWALRGLLDRFGMDLGRDLKGFGKDLGRFGKKFGRILG